MTPIDATDPETVVAGGSQKILDSAVIQRSESLSSSETISSGPNAESDDIHDVPASKTFLAKVSYQGSSINWLEMTDYTGEVYNVQQPSLPSNSSHDMEPNGIPHASLLGMEGGEQFMNDHLTIANSQHHQNLKVRQQQIFIQMQPSHVMAPQSPPPPPPQYWPYPPGGPPQGNGMPPAGMNANGDSASSLRQDDNAAMGFHPYAWVFYQGPYGVPPESFSVPGEQEHGLDNNTQSYYEREAAASETNEGSASKRRRAV